MERPQRGKELVGGTWRGHKGERGWWEVHGEATKEKGIGGRYMERPQRGKGLGESGKLGSGEHFRWEISARWEAGNKGYHGDRMRNGVGDLGEVRMRRGNIADRRDVRGSSDVWSRLEKPKRYE